MSGVKKGEQAPMDLKTVAVFARKGYKVLKKISEGAFGQVYTAMKTEGGDMCAVKVMDLEKCSDKFKEKFLPRELTILIQLRHPHVIRTHDIFRSNKKIYIFMEFAPNGTIGDALKNNGGPLTEAKAKEWFIEMVGALHYMHTVHGICHRDIKVENVLLDPNNVTKLTDFGFSKEVYDPVTREVQLSKTWCGTEPYYSPQLLKREPYLPFPVDVWALGVVLFAMLTNKFPFHYKDLKAMLREQENREYKFRPDLDLSADVRDLQAKMFDPNAGTRINTQAILDHPWVKKGRVP